MVHFVHLVVVLLAGAVSAERALAGNSLTDLIQGDTELSTLFTALNASGIVSNATTYNTTLFAPINSAFAKLDQTFLSLLVTDPEWIAHLQNLLLGHAVNGTVLSTSLSDGMVVTALNNENITVSISGNNVSLSNPQLNSSAAVVQADIEASDGVLHKIDGVLLPSFWNRDIVGLAGQIDGYSIISKLLSLSGLSSMIPPGTYPTVFAPNDQAFAALGNETLAYYTNASNVNDLQALLFRHVVLSLIPTQNMKDGQTFSTIAGNNVTVYIRQGVNGDVYKIDQGTIVTPDVLANNGIVQGIDAVLVESNVTNGTTPSPLANSPPPVAPNTPTVNVPSPPGSAPVPAPIAVPAPHSAPTTKTSAAVFSSGSGWWTAVLSAALSAVVAVVY